MSKKKARKLNILFVHMVCPGQFSDLCEYLNEEDLANAYYLTTPGNRERNLSKYQNLLGMRPDGNIVGNNAYYYSGKVERAGRISVALFKHMRELQKTLRIDLVVAHGSMGSPHFLFDELDIPIITYIEFPSYADHGWAAKFPPTEGQRLTDKNMQMLSFYEVLKSDRTIVPTQYARSLFPELLQERVTPRFEGMLPEKIEQRQDCGYDFEDKPKTLGFAARDLSSAKGLDTFIETAKQLIDQGTDIHFVIIGDEQSTTYGYERVFLDRKYGKESAVSYLDHLMRQHKLDKSRFTITGKLPYKQFSDILHKIDLFMYPVRFGAGNWGLMELLVRGCAVVASDRCYVGEMIENGENGVLVSDSSPAAWAKQIVTLMNDDESRARLGEGALEKATRFHMSNVAPQYMTIFQQTIENFKPRQKKKR